MHRIREWYRTEKSKLSTLTGKEKVSYIWEYYKLWIILLVGACAFLIYMIQLTSRERIDYRLYVTMVSTTADVGEDSKFQNSFLEYTGFSRKEYPVYFDDECYFDYAKNSAVGNSYYESLVTYIEAGINDAVIMDRDNLTSFGESGRLLDLDSEGCESIREKYGQYFIYCDPYDEEYADGEQVAVGIDLTGTELMTKYEIYEDSCALGIGEYTDSLDAVELFLDYLFEEAGDGQ
jgi:hypothetical protein